MIEFLLSRRRFFAAIALGAGLLATAPALAQRRNAYTPPAPDSIHAVAAEHGLVVAQEKMSAQVGADILKRGGNAVDAAVATGFAMAVAYPRAGNIGGGGFMVIHLADRGEDIAIDYRETAPNATTPTIFLGADGKPDPARSRDSALGIGVPGTVAGLTLALEKYGSGKFTLAELLQPTIALARDGFVAAYCDLKEIETLVNRHRSGAEDATDRLWRLLNLQLWGDVFITGRRDRWWNGALACEATV